MSSIIQTFKKECLWVSWPILIISCAANLVWELPAFFNVLRHGLFQNYGFHSNQKLLYTFNGKVNWPNNYFLSNLQTYGGGAKVSYILRHRGVQPILAYSWARPAILVEGKGKGGMFLFFLFLYFHSCSSFFPVPALSSPLLSLLSLFSLSLGDGTKQPTRVVS